MFLNTDFTEGDKPRRLPIKFLKVSKVSKTQTTLFGQKLPQPKYPSEWIYRGRTNGIKADVVIPVKDISIVEDFRIPDYFLDLIDWDRIRKRLVNKLNKLSGPSIEVRDEEDCQLVNVEENSSVQ
jgi:hypothetical protein